MEHSDGHLLLLANAAGEAAAMTPPALQRGVADPAAAASPETPEAEAEEEEVGLPGSLSRVAL